MRKKIGTITMRYTYNDNNKSHNYTIISTGERLKFIIRRHR